jgi:hypothetical protein
MVGKFVGARTADRGSAGFLGVTWGEKGDAAVVS